MLSSRGRHYDHIKLTTCKPGRVYITSGLGPPASHSAEVPEVLSLALAILTPKRLLTGQIRSGTYCPVVE
jgi:hypothetical protein